MATWITHLRIAEALLPHLPGVDETAFALGNLGPDSGIPNADWTEFDPPKAVTHFERDGDRDRTHDLAFYRDYLQSLPAGDPRYSYRLGYFVHLVCDNLWSRWIGQASRRDYAPEFLEEGHAVIKRIKSDWYDLDHGYVRDHPDSLFWRAVLPAPNPSVELPFLSERGVHFSLDHIRSFYSQPNPDRQLDRPYTYLNADTLTRYVDDAVTACLDILHQLAQPVDIADLPTAIRLLPEYSLTPYDAPLGDTQSEPL